jgi:ribosomal protein L40E
MIVNCPNCGAETAPRAKFCSKCGSSLGVATLPEPTPETSDAVSESARDDGVAITEATSPASGDAQPPGVPDSEERVACWRCGTDNPSDRRFCRQCGARLVDLALRLSEIEEQLASTRDALSHVPAQLSKPEQDTLNSLQLSLQQATEAHEAGKMVTAGELLTQVERENTSLAGRVSKLEEAAKVARLAQQAQEAMSAVIEDARSSLDGLTLVPTSAVEKALRRLEIRLASGTRALQRNQFQQAHAVFAGAKAENEAKAVADRLAAAQNRQHDLEVEVQQLEEHLGDLGARHDDIKQQFLNDGVESTTVERKLARVGRALTQARAVLDKRNVSRASRLVESVEADLDTLDQHRLTKARQQETRQAHEARLGQEKTDLVEGVGTLRADLEKLSHLDITRQSRLLAELERKLAQAESTEPRKAETLLNAIRRDLQALRQQLPGLQSQDDQIGELRDRVVALQHEYEHLHEQVAKFDGPEWATERQSIETNLARLAGVLEKSRFESARPLESALSGVGDPTRLSQSMSARIQTEQEVSERLDRMQTKAKALAQDLKDAQREGLGLREEREQLAQLTALLGRAEELSLQGRRQQASTALDAIDEEQLDQLKNEIEDRLSSAKLLQRKTTLSVARMPETGGVTSYNVILNVSGAGLYDASSIQGSIKIACSDRVDLRQAIDDLTTVINVLFGAQSTLRGKMPDLPEHEALDSLSELGDLMYRLFLPTAIQKHLRGEDTPVLIASNDLELPWELMYVDDDFLCLRVPIGRMPMLRDFPRRNDYTREDKLRFLLIGNPTGDLPATEEEVKSIARRLSKQQAEVEMWLGDEVTGLKLHRALASGRYDVIHYSGHAYFNLQNPDESGLLLAGQNVFIAQTIQRTLRGRPLILLNACESGREMMQDGEVSYTASETEGLASSFIRGGALGILGTLWPIFDEGAAEFAATFYDGLLSRKALGEAVRLARLTLRESHPHDVTWASFVLYGDPTLTVLE